MHFRFLLLTEKIEQFGKSAAVRGLIITLLIDGKGFNNYEEIYGIIIDGGNIFDVGGVGV